MSDKMINFDGVQIPESAILAKGFSAPEPEELFLWSAEAWHSSTIGARRSVSGEWSLVVDTFLHPQGEYDGKTGTKICGLFGNAAPNNKDALLRELRSLIKQVEDA